MRSRSLLEIMAALALLAVLGLGSACHFWHHLSDPHCDGATSHGSPCATCASLHSAAVVSDCTIATLATPAMVGEVAQVEPDAPQFASPGIGAPRAPPRT